MPAKICVFKIAREDGGLPSAQDLITVREALQGATKHPETGEFQIVVSGFNITRELFEIPDGHELVLTPDRPLEIKRNRAEIIEGEVVKENDNGSTGA